MARYLTNVVCCMYVYLLVNIVLVTLMIVQTDGCVSVVSEHDLLAWILKQM